MRVLVGVLSWVDWFYIYSGLHLCVCCVLFLCIVWYVKFSVFLCLFVLVLVRPVP